MANSTIQYPNEFTKANALTLLDQLMVYIKSSDIVQSVDIQKLSDLIGAVSSASFVAPPPAGGTLPTTAGNKWTILGAGSYNSGAIVVPANNMGIAYYNGTAWSVTNIPLPVAESITDWIAQAYAIGKQVYYAGNIWVLNAAAVAGDVPGVSAKWVKKINAGAQDWSAKTYQSGEQVFHAGNLYQSNINTLVTDVPGVSTKWVKKTYTKYSQLQLTRPNTIIDATGNYSTQTSYSAFVATEKITVNVGDTFAYSYILRNSAGSLVDGIYGYDASGSYVGKPINASESFETYTHKDANIKFIAFVLYANRNTAVNFINREIAHEIDTNRYNINGDFFQFLDANAGANIIANEIIAKDRLPVTLRLNTNTTGVNTADNSSRIRMAYANINQATRYLIVAVRLKSISDPTITTITINNRVMRVGDMYKFSANGYNPNSQVSITLASSQIATTATYDLEIRTISSEVYDKTARKKGNIDLAGLNYQTVSDVALKAIGTINPMLKDGMITCLGDSIFNNNEGGPARCLATDMEMRLTNLAQSGANLPEILSEDKLAAIPLNSNIITLSGGTNQWYVEGAIDSRDPATTHGLINRALDYCYTNIPIATVILVTPNKVANPTANVPITKTAKAMRDIAEYRGVVLCDWFMNSGINEFNHAKWLSDGIHPSYRTTGYLAYRLKQAVIMPISEEFDLYNGVNMMPIN